jgi:hypothetical protein
MAFFSRRYLEVSLIALAIVAGCGHSKSPASRADGGSGAGGIAAGQDASDTTTADADSGGTGGVAGGAGLVADAAGDATGGGGANASVLACPDTPPLRGTTCGGQTCVYEDCAGAGRTIAQCYPAGSFDFTVTACTPASCAGATPSPCPMGSLCLKKPVNGVLTPTCLPNPCGRGPITCDCVTCSGACSIVGTADGVTVTCQTP